MRPLPSVRPRGRRAALAALAGTALLAAVGVTGSANAAPVAPPTRLKAAGPINGENGFPVWYKDSNNLSLSLCLDQENPLCGGLAAEMPDPTQPVSFPDNYPAEAFYMLADSTMTLPSGTAVLTTGLESAFSTEEAAAGGQIVFGRVLRHQRGTNRMIFVADRNHARRSWRVQGSRQLAVAGISSGTPP
jgi:hypothetical protein